jgi:hypothetical protein
MSARPRGSNVHATRPNAPQPLAPLSRRYLPLSWPAVVVEHGRGFGFKRAQGWGAPRYALRPIRRASLPSRSVRWARTHKPYQEGRTRMHPPHTLHGMLAPRGGASAAPQKTPGRPRIGALCACVGGVCVSWGGRLRKHLSLCSECSSCMHHVVKVRLRY